MKASVPATAAKCWSARLLARRASGPDAFVAEVGLPDDPGPVAPGQFAMLSPGDGGGPCIPRPFSVYDRTGPARFTFLVQVLGEGTRALAAVPPGGSLTCTMPLGRGFRVAPPERPVVLVAGGVGSAPFLLYARERAAAGAADATWLLYGARTADRLYDRETFAASGVRFRCASQDGAAGHHGTVLDLLAARLDAGEIPAGALFAACGPAGLLHAFADFARARGLAAQLSLETYMGCGWGGCNACPVPTEPDGPLGAWPWAKTCTQGPVFDLAAIRF